MAHSRSWSSIANFQTMRLASNGSMNPLYPNAIFCPKCQKVTKHYRVATRPSYSCQFCGHHEHPMKGTIFENSATSLKLWFHGIFLMASTGCGISAKQLERELGVTYKCAWRMFNRIRSMLDESEDGLSGRQKQQSGALSNGKAASYHALWPIQQRVPFENASSRARLFSPMRLASIGLFRAQLRPSTRLPYRWHLC